MVFSLNSCQSPYPGASTSGRDFPASASAFDHDVPALTSYLHPTYYHSCCMLSCRVRHEDHYNHLKEKRKYSFCLDQQISSCYYGCELDCHRCKKQLSWHGISIEI